VPRLTWHDGTTQQPHPTPDSQQLTQSADISAGERRFLEFFAQNTAGSAGPETPPNEDEFIPDLVLSSPDNSFSWDGWKQPSAPFLWTLTDIAHALGSDFETAERWYLAGNIPKPAWNDHLTWHGDTIKLPIRHGTEIKPWIDNVTALTNKILKNLPNTTPDTEQDSASQNQTQNTTPADPTTRQHDTRPGHDSATLHQWHYEGCPRTSHALPRPHRKKRSLLIPRRQNSQLHQHTPHLARENTQPNQSEPRPQTRPRHAQPHTTPTISRINRSHAPHRTNPARHQPREPARNRTHHGHTARITTGDRTRETCPSHNQTTTNHMRVT